MSLPEKILVGPLVYQVTDDRGDYGQAVIDNDGLIWGRISYGKGTIVLCPDQPEGQKRMALLHEVLHAVWHLSDRSHADDEDVIRRIAAPLLDTLQRNPVFVAYLTAQDEV